eukprot:4050358-Pleurochrysis_carterae.AAC.3
MGKSSVRYHRSHLHNLLRPLQVLPGPALPSGLSTEEGGQLAGSVQVEEGEVIEPSPATAEEGKVIEPSPATAEGTFDITGTGLCDGYEMEDK